MGYEFTPSRELKVVGKDGENYTPAPIDRAYCPVEIKIASTQTVDWCDVHWGKPDASCETCKRIT